MDKSRIIEIQDKLKEAIQLGQEGVLKGVDANSLHKKIRNLELLNFFENKILKAKYEKLINSIDTLWTDRSGYTGGGIFEKYKEIIDLELAQNEVQASSSIQGFKQEFFKSGEEANIKSMLKTLFSNAKNSIIIYDKFFSVELLKALSEINNTLQVTVIFKQKRKIIKEEHFNAFEVLYNMKITRIPSEDNSIHDRYYIIDDNVYSLGSSVQENINGTLFTPVVESEGNKIIKEVNQYLKK